MKLLPLPAPGFRCFLASLLFAAATFSFVWPSHAAPQGGQSFVVNSLADTDDGSCDTQNCTLREAINAANSAGGGALISFNLSGTITLGSALPNILRSCTIDGSGQTVTVSGNNSVGIFQATGPLSSYSSGNYTVAFNALTITKSASSNSAILLGGSKALITNCLLADNNNGSGSGGALRVGPGSSATIANCTFFNNSAATGGGIYAQAYLPNHFFTEVYIYSTTFYNNHATFPTGNFNLAAADIYAIDATAEIRNTVLVNTDGRPGGFGAEDNAQGLTYADLSDICNVDIDSQTFNATQATAAQINLDPILTDNGGSTKTLALLPGSVAINAGSNGAATGAPVNNQDQRGFVRVRPGDPACDVGAYESGANGSLVVTTVTDLTAATAGQNSLRTAVTYAQTLTGPQTITFAAPLAGQTVTLSNAWDNTNGYHSSSAFQVDGNVIIQGPTTAPGITLKVADASQLRHFVISSGGTLNLQNLTLTGGKPTLGGFDFGGAVWNFGTLAVRNCTFTGNTAVSEGGAIQSWGESPSLLIENSTFTGNHSNGIAGAIDCGSLSMTFRYVTMANNTANDGNALVIYGHPLTMVNGLIGGAGNEGVGSANGGAFSGSSTNNLFSSSPIPSITNGVNSNRTGVPVAQLKLGTLANNGGPTQTIALQPSSVAVDAGVAIAGITTDQIGTTRPQGNLPDVGAFELIPTLVLPGLYTDVNGQGGNNSGSLVGYPGGTTPGFTLLRGLNSAGGMVFDPAGNLYYTGYDSSSRFANIYKLVPGSSNPQGIASFFGQIPSSLAINASGDLLYLVSNVDTSTTTRIWRVNLTTGSQDFLLSASGVHVAGAAVDAAGNLYYADVANQLIRVLAADGGSTVFASNVSARGLAFDGSGNLFVSTNGNPGNDSILKYTPSGTQSTFTTGLANVPLGLSFDRDGNLFVAETGAASQPGDIIKILPDGTKSTFDSNLGPAPASGNGGPQYLAAYPRPIAAAIPIVSPLGGTYEKSVQVSITSISSATTVRYTLDGSTPSSTSGQIYSAPITLTQSATVKAIAYGAGWIDSPIASVAYTVLPPLAYWRNLQGLAADGSQDSANPSGDGISNLAKFAFNLAPNAGDLTKPNYQLLTPDGTAGLPLITRDDQGRLVIEFVRRKASANPGVAYIVETGTDLAGWNPLDLTNATVASLDAFWERVTVVDPTIGAKRFGRVRVTSLGVYFNDFNVGLGPATLNGSAVYLNQAVQLTDQGQQGVAAGLIFNGMNAAPQLSGFTARFNLAIGPTATGNPGDGVSFAVGTLPSAWGETGPQTPHSLAVGFDTYDNGGVGGIGIHIWINGTHLTANATNPYTSGVSVPVEIAYDQSTGLMVKFNGATIFSNVAISGFNFQSTDQFGFGARTGAAAERVVVDDVQIVPH